MSATSGSEGSDPEQSDPGPGESSSNPERSQGRITKTVEEYLSVRS